MQDPIKSNPFTPTYKKDIVWAGLNGSRFINDPLRLFPSLLGRLCTRLVLCNNASVGAAADVIDHHVETDGKGSVGLGREAEEAAGAGLSDEDGVADKR